MGADYYNDPTTGKSYPTWSGYSGGDGQVIHKVGTGAEITGSSSAFVGQSGWVTTENKLYIYDGSQWRAA